MARSECGIDCECLGQLTDISTAHEAVRSYPFCPVDLWCCFWFGWVKHSHKRADVASIFKRHLDFFRLLYLEKKSLEHYILSKLYTHRHVPGVWAYLVKSLSQMNVSVSQAPQLQSNWCAAMFSSLWCYALPDKCKFPSSFILKTLKEYSAQQLLSYTELHVSSLGLGWIRLHLVLLCTWLSQQYSSSSFLRGLTAKGGVNSWRKCKIPFVLFGHKMFCSNGCNTSESLLSVHSTRPQICSYQVIFVWSTLKGIQSTGNWLNLETDMHNTYGPMNYWPKMVEFYMTCYSENAKPYITWRFNNIVLTHWLLSESLLKNLKRS